MKTKTKMKSKSLLMILTVVLLSWATTDIMAQRGRGFGPPDGKPGMGPMNCKAMNLPDLSEDQKEQIKDLKMKHMKESLPLKHDLKIKHAELRKLMTQEGFDTDDINDKVDEITNVHGKLMKMHAAHRQEIRKILNNEQRTIYDHHFQGMGMGHGPKFGKDKPFKGKGFYGKKHWRDSHPYWSPDSEDIE